MGELRARGTPGTSGNVEASRRRDGDGVRRGMRGPSWGFGAFAAVRGKH
jgi:hypothetical protein